ncbi:MAG: metal-dependent transcriptional regulator, partial [Singulisphaera sp.]
MSSLTVEHCVKAIHLIASEDSEDVSVGSGELARALGTSSGVVIGMMKLLSRSDLAVYTRYEGVRLTPSGRNLALKVLRRQRLLELFLARALSLPWDVVRAEAERLEHALSDRVAEQIDICLGHPSVDPHGDPIPKPDGSSINGQGSPLGRLPGGGRFRVVRVADRDSTLLRYLTECGVGLGTTGEVVENRPEAGVVVLSVGGRAVALGREAAGVIFVVLEDDEGASRPRNRGPRP